MKISGRERIGSGENVFTRKRNSTGRKHDAIILKTLMTKAKKQSLFWNMKDVAPQKTFLRITTILNVELKWMIIHSLVDYFMQLLF